MALYSLGACDSILFLFVFTCKTLKKPWWQGLAWLRLSPRARVWVLIGAWLVLDGLAWVQMVRTFQQCCW